ncbi:uncharacterized protein LOC110837744 [Zootermopsis nevadensis]|nr:uncharacterized protein LOC110837744 [Zootermopsis nevadensis]
MLEEALKKIVGKSSSRIVHSGRRSDYNIEDSLSPDDPAPEQTFGQRRSEGNAQRVAPRVIPTQHNKKRQLKNKAEFTRTCTGFKAAKAKMISDDRNVLLETPAVEYKEYAVAVASYWDKEFVQKFSTKNYLLETQRQLQEVFYKRKLLASHGREKLVNMDVEASVVQHKKPSSAEQEQMPLSPVLSDGLSLTFSPPIPPVTPILDPLQYLRKVFPKAENEGLQLFENENVPPQCLLTQHTEVGPRQQTHDNLQQYSHARSTSVSLEPYSTLPLVSSHKLGTTYDPIASDNMYRAAGLYVPCKFSLSMDTDEVDFKYYPHTF